jgi:hypothetical protein
MSDRLKIRIQQPSKEQRPEARNHDIASRQESLRAPPPSIVIIIMAEAIHPSPGGITDRYALLL